ncbi:MAG TPA: pitrilysin family protein [Candidatus Dormibacteraeota bacterium]|nr:pitrilysin family protein [Candidatus Dormibacteraeota bacterium]
MSADRTALGSGLVLIARENRAARSIAVRLVLEAGAAFDPQGREGTAALAADLLDRGAGGLSAGEIAGYFDDLGVSYSAAARRDTLEVELRLLSEHLPGVLERLRILAAEPTFPDVETERQKGQTLTAIAERDQDTSSVCEMALAREIFPPGHPYHAPRLGTRDSVRRIGRDGLVAFHQERFGPAGAVLSMAGDFDRARALEIAAGVFGSWTGGTRQARAIIPDPPVPDRPVVVARPIDGKTQADIGLGFRGLRRLSPDLPAALVLNSIVGEFALGGRLGKAIRDRAGLAYYVYSRFTAGLGAGPFVVRAGVSPERVRRALDLMRRTIERVRRQGVTPAEVNDSKRALAAAVPRRMETNTESAAVLADAEFYGHGIEYPEKLPGLIRAVTRTEVEEAAERYLTLGRHVLIVAGPPIDQEALQ